MNALELAGTKLHRTLGLGGRSYDERRPTGALGDSFGVWVQNEFLPACETLWGRTSFQRLATRPQRLLAGDLPEDEQAIRGALTALAGCCAFLAETVDCHSKLLGRKLCKISHAVVGPVSCKSQVPLTVRRLRGRLQRMAQTDLKDIVSATDYFGPRHATTEKCGGETLQRGEFIVAFNPELTYVGNHVIRCMLVRLKVLATELEQYGRQIHAALGADRQFQVKLAAQTNNVGVALEQLRSQLLTSREAQLVESAMALTQVYVGYALGPIDTAWLELPEELVAVHRRRRFVRPAGLDASEALDRLSRSIDAIMNYYQRMPVGQSELEEAVAEGGLVVVEARREIWWRKERLSIAWTQRKWEIFWALVKSRGRAVRPENVYEEIVADSTLPGTFKRMKDLLPADLGEYFQNGPEPKSYCLMLPASRIHLMCQVAEGEASGLPK